MENLRPNKCSSPEFEFGCITTPGSPNSPADQFFSNGKLLPHFFPVQRQSNGYYSSFSRASSISSKGSLVSSRSNSTNSRSSNCSSARTSTSEGSSSSSSSSSFERRLSSNRLCARREKNVADNSKVVLGPQRWQLIAAAPVLKHRVGSRSTAEKPDRKMPAREGPGGGKTPWFGRRILKSFVSACKECHAITT